MMFHRLLGPYRKAKNWVQGSESHERTLELLGAMLAQQTVNIRPIKSLHDAEFRVFSQFGDDGIIQWLVARLPMLPPRFVEFGVEDYAESNTRFLMVNNNWAGLVMDGSAANIARLRRRKWFWRYNLTASACFLTRDNVDRTIADWATGDGVGLLHIDVDGNDYWLWDAIQCVKPGIVIMEYNALFGSQRPITVPYNSKFQRHAAHYSGQYFGASIAALTHLAGRKGYALIGCNSAGNNAYFLRHDLLDEDLQEVSPTSAFVKPQFRDSRDERGRLDYRDYTARQKIIRGLPVVDVTNGQIEPF